METTQIQAEKTASEIMTLLKDAGATRILTEYNKFKRISGLSFILNIRGIDVPFMLPVRTEPIFNIFQGRRDSWTRKDKAEKDQEQAERVAWRQLLRWIQAQLAMIETGMVEAGEVFMPYIQVAGGSTYWEKAIESGRLALPMPREESD